MEGETLAAAMIPEIRIGKYKKTDFLKLLRRASNVKIKWLNILTNSK